MSKKHKIPTQKGPIHFKEKREIGMVRQGGPNRRGVTKAKRKVGVQLKKKRKLAQRKESKRT